MKKIYSYLKVLVIIVVLVNLFACFCLDKILFQPPQRGNKIENLHNVKVDEDTDASITIYEHKVDSSKATILFFHGNGEDIISRKEFALGKKYNYYIVDYRGYGASRGTPSTVTFIDDALKAYDYIVNHCHVDSSRLIVHGFSLGGSAAIGVAARRPCAGVIIQSSFKSVMSVPFRYNLFFFDALESIDIVSQIKTPMCFIHGEVDQIVPISHGMALYEAARGEKECHWIAQAGHNDLEFVIWEKYPIIIDTFIEKCIATQIAIGKER